MRSLALTCLFLFTGSDREALAQPPAKSKDQPPQALYALQLGADPGKTTKLTLRGLRLDTATEVRLGDPKSSGKVIGKGRKTPIPTQMSADLVGDTEVDVEVTLPTEVPGGLVPVSVVGPGGEGKPFHLLVNDDVPRTKEVEPNDGFKQAMAVTVPVIVEAAFKQGQDPDVYRLEGRAGDRFRVEVQARRFGSPAGVLVALYDAGGRIVTTGEPAPGGADQELRIKLPTDGTYYVSAIEASDQGGPMYVYRLAVRPDK